MKKIVMAVFLGGLFMNLVIAGCGKDEKESTGKDLDKERESGEYADVSMLQKAADKEIASFMTSLKYSLKEAMRDGGPANAISVCSDAAPEIAMAHARDGWEIWRLTDRPRNPNNEVNDPQYDILYEFSDSTTAPPFVIEWQEDKGERKFYYYKPIYVDQMCLNCHGVREDLQPEVVKKLDELYPDDKATGYYAGDLRGMFMVVVDWPKGKALAEKLAGETK